MPGLSADHCPERAHSRDQIHYSEDAMQASQQTKERNADFRAGVGMFGS